MDIHLYRDKINKKMFSDGNIYVIREMGHEKSNEYIQKLWAKYKEVPEACEILKRVHGLFYNNAQNRWRRWDYVKPEMGQCILFTYMRDDGRDPTTFIVDESNIKYISRFCIDGPIWYQIPIIP